MKYFEHMIQPCLKSTSDFSVTWVNNLPFLFELCSYHLQPKQVPQTNRILLSLNFQHGVQFLVLVLNSGLMNTLINRYVFM